MEAEASFEENIMFMTTYFDTRKNFCEVVFSKAGKDVPADKQPTRESIKAYADVVCPVEFRTCLLYTSPSPRDLSTSRMPSSA